MRGDGWAVPGLPEVLAGVPGHDARLRRAVPWIELNLGREAWAAYVDSTAGQALANALVAYGRAGVTVRGGVR